MISRLLSLTLYLIVLWVNTAFASGISLSSGGFVYDAPPNLVLQAVANESHLLYGNGNEFSPGSISQKTSKYKADADGDYFFALLADFIAAKSVGDLSKLGKAGTGKGVREVTGNATDARKLFDQLRGNNPAKEVKSGVFVSKGANGGNVTFRASSKSGPPTVDVHGIQKGVRKIKFLSE